MEKINMAMNTTILSRKAIAEFQSAFFAEHKVYIPPEQAEILALRLLQIFKHIYKPVPKLNNLIYEKR